MFNMLRKCVGVIKRSILILLTAQFVHLRGIFLMSVNPKYESLGMVITN